MKKLLVILIIMLSPYGLMAHPGHGFFEGTSVQHYISSPLHMGLVFMVLVLLIVVVRKKVFKTNR